MPLFQVIVIIKLLIKQTYFTRFTLLGILHYRFATHKIYLKNFIAVLACSRSYRGMEALRR